MHDRGESFRVNRESTRGYSLEVYREKYFGENGWNVDLKG